MPGETQPVDTPVSEETQTTVEAVTSAPQESPDRASLFYPQEDSGQEETKPDEGEQAAEVAEQTELPPDEPTHQTEQQEEEETGEPIRSFSELVDIEEWDPEWADSLVLNQKIDGEEREVTIGELRNVHQTLEAATKRLDDAKTKSKVILDEADQAKNITAEKLAEAAALTLMVEETLGLKDADQRLDQIRREQGDTAYLVEKDKVDSLRQKVGQLKAYTSESMQAVMSQMNGGMTDAEKQELAQSEHVKLLERIPAWKDQPELASQETKEMVEYLQAEYAYEDDQISESLDHRLWDMARKAMLYDRGQKAAGVTKKELKKIPMKRMRPSSNAETASRPKSKDRVSTMYGSS